MKRYFPPVIALVLGVLVALPFPGQSATYRPPSSSIADNSITSAKITDGTIVNADISSSANITASKVNLAGLNNTDALAGGSVYSFIASSTNGTISWQPSTNIISGYSNEGVSTAYIHQIPVSTSTKLMIFASAQRDTTCNNASGESRVNVDIKQSTFAGTTTPEVMEFGGANNESGCNGAYSYMHTATTTETVSVGLNTVQATVDRAVISVLRLPF